MGSTPPRQLHVSPENKQPDDDYKAASNAADIDFDQYMPKLRAEHKMLRKIATTIVAVVLVIGLGAVAYIEGPHIGSLLSNKAKAKTPAVVVANNTISAPSQQYMSTNQNLSFNYPPNWKVNETTDEVTAKSPDLRLTDDNGQSVTGQVILTVRDKNVPMSEFKSGNALAVMASQVINYSAPAADQRGSTYLSFLKYANSKGNGISGVYVTGNTGYQLNQQAYAADFGPVDPVIALNFVSCGDSSCSGSTTPISISLKSWSVNGFSSPLLKILESFSI